MRLLKLGSVFVCVLFLKLGATENRAVAECPEDSLPCDDGVQCFKRKEWCDKTTHCQDKSDEAYCGKKKWFSGGDPNGCKDTHFLCGDGRCVPLVAKCDGFKDCHDGSDEKCEPESTVDNYYEYESSTVETTTKDTISENSFDTSDEKDTLNPTPLPSITPKPVETSDILIHSSTIPVDSNVRENEEVSPHAPISVPTDDPSLLSSPTPVNFYASRREEESSQSVFESPSPSVSSFAPPVTTEPVYTPRSHQTQNTRTTTTTSRPLWSTTHSSTRSHHSSRGYERPQGPVTLPYDRRIHFDQSARTTPQPSRSYDSRQPDRYGASFTHPTRSHIPSTSPRRDSYQQITQPARTYEPRRDTYQYQTQPTRSHDSGRYPNNYSTQPTRSYYTSRDHYQYNSQPNRPYDSTRYPYSYHYNTHPTRTYDSTRDPYHYQARNSRTHDTRRDPYEYQTSSSVPTGYPYYPYQSPRELTILTATPGTRHPAVTDRVYLHHGYYYGYYDERGQFVVLRHDFEDRQPPTVDYRNRQTTRNPYPVRERYRQEPTYATPTPIAFTRQLKVPSRFYFSKDFARIYGDKNHSYLRKGKEFILSLRNSTGDWGVETPRALVALSLINNSFVNDTYENNMMQKFFQVFLGSSLLRNGTETTTLSRLAMAVNGLLATCQNPRDFHGTDLTEIIRKKLYRRKQERTTNTSPVNPSVYLSLCLAGKELTHYDLDEMMTRLGAHSTPDEYSKDMMSLSIIALSCHLQQQEDRDSDYYVRLQSLLNNATAKLLDRMLDDGSFGSVYSTAIAAQALISVNDSKQWNAESTFDYLKQQQLKDGSFGDFLATYWTIPALSGRSLIHLRNTQCTPPKADRVLTPAEIMDFTGPKQHIRYSLYIGYPNVNGNSLEVFVPQGISFFDIMRVAEHQNSAFKFYYEEKNELIHVYSISNVPNDSERGFQWYLYVKKNTDAEQLKLNDRERVTGDIRNFYPKSDQHVIFWYHPSDINS